MKFGLMEDKVGFAAVWENVFGDPADFVLQFARAYPKDCFYAAVSENGETASILSLLPICFSSENENRPARYLYAVATDEKYRGQGLSSKLFSEAMKILQEPLVFTVPAEESLFAFYKKQGFEDWSNCADLRFYAKKTALKAEKIDAESYVALREKLLSGKVHIVFTAREVQFAGQGYRISDGQSEGVLLGDLRGNEWLFQECIGFPFEEAASAAAKEGEICRVIGQGSDRAFSMVYDRCGKTDFSEENIFGLAMM